MMVKDIQPYINFSRIYVQDATGEWQYAKNCRLIYLISGSTTIRTPDTEYKMAADSILFCAGYKKYHVTSANSHLIVLNFHTVPAKGAPNEVCAPIRIGLNEEINESCETIEDCEYLNSYLYLENMYKYKKIMTEIAEEYSSKQIFSQEKCSGLIKALIADLYRESLRQNHETSDAVTAVIAEITKNLGQKVDCKSLAAKVGYHEYHLNRLFLKYTGSSLYSYAFNHKINEAKNMLTDTNAPIAHVAESVGFCSTSHFSAYFKKAVGMTPNEFRQKMKSKL